MILSKGNSKFIFEIVFSNLNLSMTELMENLSNVYRLYAEVLITVKHMVNQESVLKI